MHAQDYIRELAANGRYFFTTSEAQNGLDASLNAVRGQLRRLKKKGLIAEPVRSFHVIVPPEYMRLGCVPAEHFIHQLMQHWAEPYYVGLLSAAERHGAAHQRPQAVQIMTQKSRRSIECGTVRIEFCARHDLEKMPIVTINTPRGVLNYSTPEVTALELVGYPGKAGGLNNVAIILAELAEEMSPDKLSKVAQLCPVSWAQRLGYLLELVEQEEMAHALLPLAEKAASVTPLRRAAKAIGTHNARWKLIINVEVEPDE